MRRGDAAGMAEWGSEKAIKEFLEPKAEFENEKLVFLVGLNRE